MPRAWDIFRLKIKYTLDDIHNFEFDYCTVEELKKVMRALEVVLDVMKPYLPEEIEEEDDPTKVSLSGGKTYKDYY